VINANCLVRKPCYCSENRAMPLQTSIRAEIYSGIALSSVLSCCSRQRQENRKGNERRGTQFKVTSRLYTVCQCYFL